ncbi:MAG: DNA replication/repair protein RecF, partial [Thermodesulfobacteriota bacterium]
LVKNFSADKGRGHTTIGPHRDNINFEIDGVDASRFASQGQSKNLVLALKASEIKLISDLTGVSPILLLDDITSELDIKRKNFLFNILLEFDGQIFVTSTSKNEIPYSGESKSFLIKSGMASFK